MEDPSSGPSSDASRRLVALLRLKRHELPPPGFHRDFPAGVIRRIEAEDRSGAQSPWWAPAAWMPRLAGANGILAAGVLLLGFSAVRFALKETPAGVPETSLAGGTGGDISTGGPVTPVMAGVGLHGPSLLKLDPSVLQPVQFPAASNEWPHRAVPAGTVFLTPGIYRVGFSTP